MTRAIDLNLLLTPTVRAETTLVEDTEGHRTAKATFSKALRTRFWAVREALPCWGRGKGPQCLAQPDTTLRPDLIRGVYMQMRLRIFSAALAVLTLFSTLAVADTATQATQECAVKTRAPGKYNLSTAADVPNVIPGEGGSTGGAARINDCLADVYTVQYGVRRDAGLAQEPVWAVGPDAALYTGCSRQHGVMRGGSSLCVSP